MAEPTERILTVLRSRRGVDLSSYRPATLEAAVASRCELLNLPIDAYVDRLERDFAEPAELIEATLVPHTSFFRDQLVMSALEALVLPLLRRRFTEGTLRAWSIGTATGEEAWTLAMLLDEAGGAFEVLGTDLSASAIETARRGVYPGGARRLTPARRAYYFEPDVGTMRVGEQLRSRVSFEVHDFVGHQLAPTSAVVASFPLLLCRNVLLWFDDHFRRMALQRIAAFLPPGGVLVLGRSESLPPGTRGLTPLRTADPSLRLYEREAAPF